MNSIVRKSILNMFLWKKNRAGNNKIECNNIYKNSIKIYKCY